MTAITDRSTEGPVPGKRAGRGDHQIQVVEFSLGKEIYAIDLFDVKEIVENTSITRLPRTTKYVRGVIDLRGEITAIIDLNQWLSSGTETTIAPGETRRIIVLDEQLTGTKTGILVDDVLSVSTFEPEDIDQTATSRYQSESAILGIIRKRNQRRDAARTDLKIWLDIRQILQSIGCIADTCAGEIKSDTRPGSEAKKT